MVVQCWAKWKCSPGLDGDAALGQMELERWAKGRCSNALNRGAEVRLKKVQTWPEGMWLCRL